jgi:putative transposase
LIQAELLGISRESLYYRPISVRPEEVALKRRIDEIYTARPFYGSRKVTALLRREGQSVNRKAVQRHMREMGIAGICPGPNLSRRKSEQAMHPYLLRNLVVKRPDHHAHQAKLSWLDLVGRIEREMKIKGDKRTTVVQPLGLIWRRLQEDAR